MSINSALLAGVSGLISNSSALAALSDNISNVNTVAYKRNQVNFANVVTAQAVQGRYSAGGVQAITRQYVSQQGLIQTSNSATDLAISGNGFFVTTSTPTAANNDPRLFTRSGSFSVDDQGYMVNDSGLYLQGWKYDTQDQSFPVNPSNLTAMTSIKITDLGAAVAPTTQVAVTANLNRNIPLTNLATPYDPAITPMTQYSIDPDGADAIKPDFTMELNVIDSQGSTRKIEIAYLRHDTDANTWFTEIYVKPPGDMVNGATNFGSLATGLTKFNADGTIDLANSNMLRLDGTDTTLQANSTLTIGASAAAGAGADGEWAEELGLGASEFTFDLSKITQYASASTVSSISTDGAGVGNVIGINVDEAGVITATYDNNQIRTIAKLGLATYQNPDALKKVSGNAYIGTVQAGDLVLKEPGLGGAGVISPSTLEASTVDLSSEFTGLIQTQKAYSASSKIITTADQMLEELINIKR